MRKVSKVFLFVVILPVIAFAEIDNNYGELLIMKTKKTISVDFQGVALVNLLKVISQQSGLNFVTTEAVQERKITLYIEDVPLKKAMDVIFTANNLAYEYYPQANIFVVKEMGKPTIELRTKIYTLKYARVSNSRIQQEIDNLLKGEGGSDSGGTKGGITQAVKESLTKNGKVIEDELSNSLVVIDVPSQIPAIDHIVRSLDVPQPKVLIEVEMLDVSKRVIDKLGVNWPQTLASLDVTGARATKFPFWGSKANNDAIEFSDVASPGGWEFSALNGRKFAPAVLTVIGAKLTLDFLKTNTDTKSIARPKILTLSNETAEIKITTDEAIGIKQSDTEEGDTEITIERSETGTRLRVTPQVNLITREITLMVESVEKAVRDSGFSASESAFITGTIKDPEERSTKAMVRIKDGEVLLLGGLIKRVGTDNRSKVPILGDIPVIGKLFKHKEKDTTERELLIFITPHIVEDTLQVSHTRTLLKRERGEISFKRNLMRIALDNFSKE